MAARLATFDITLPSRTQLTARSTQRRATRPRLGLYDPNRVASAALWRAERDAALQRSMKHDAAIAELNPGRVHAALAGDPVAVQQLLQAVTPIVQARVARALLRRSGGRSRDVQQEVADLTQEVFVALFSDDAKALRAWDPTLGLSLANFVGLLAQRRVSSIFRVRRRSPWTEDPSSDVLDSAPDDLDQSPDAQVGSRERLHLLFEHLQASLSPRGLELFYRLYVDEQPIAEICEQTGMNADAVYQWKTRLGKAARTALDELQPQKAGAR